MIGEWSRLPKYMRTQEVRPYYEKLKKKRMSLFFKREFDVVVSALMLIILSPVMIAISVAIVTDSKGGVFFRQERVTQNGRKFKIFKFRTMIANAEEQGTQVTVKNDMRITRVGRVLRKFRLDEFPQLINILIGDMSFVGTRPEVPQFVKAYQAEMFATLLLPAGLTSEASILYKDEEILLESAEDANKVYIEQVLPIKMEYNLKSLDKFNFLNELGTMIKTVLAVIR